MSRHLLRSAVLLLAACSPTRTPPPKSPPPAAPAPEAPVDHVAPLVAELDTAIEQELTKAKERTAATPPLSLTDKLVRELSHMSAVDDLLRKAVKWPVNRRLTGPDIDKFNTALGIRTLEIDRAHANRVIALAEAHGWFRISTVGETADTHAWKLIRRSVDNRTLQARAIELAQDAINAKDTSAQEYASLVDELAIAAEKPQEYGTQGDCLGPGSWEPAPTREPDTVDSRRSALGLGTAAQVAIAQGKSCF